ncbi:riboflavin biosynthesis protein RibF [bacterium]|nr:riboflavin biosynthesis protein RibF [bacterium]
MKIFTSPDSVPKEKISLAIGNFDGVHLGHAEIIRQCRSDTSCRSAILTFDIHPRKFLYPEFAPRSLTLPFEKYAFFRTLGIDFVIELPFAEYCQMDPLRFLDTLKQKLDLKNITIGFNFFFGKNQKGNSELAFWWGRSAGVKINVVQPFLKNGTRISSTAIRELILTGHMKNAASLLVYPFIISGEVKRGKQIGRTLRFPTLNLETPDKIMPPDGVYVTQTVFDGRQFTSLTNIGTNPTIDAESKLKIIETWVDSEDIGELYGKKISVYFLKKIRDEIRFSSKEKLVETIQHDKEFCRDFIESNDIGQLPDIFKNQE